MRVADLFCGMGGLSYGFSKNGFEVLGYDINKHVPLIYQKNDLGKAVVFDLSKKVIPSQPSILLGGPPCKPWSTINLRKRLLKHEDYKLLGIYFKNVVYKNPDIFIMENVIPVKNDIIYNEWIKLLQTKYSVKNSIIKYAEYGAPTKRRRLITVGFKNIEAADFFSYLKNFKKAPKTVGDVISEYIFMEKSEYPDHEWPNFKTINKYKKYYETGKYGWYKLKLNEPAPSFGNIMKTYTLHPLAGENEYPLRVISVREAMSIMGFDKDFSFPPNIGHTIKYQMVADAVSPIFSECCAVAIKEMLNL